MTTDPIPDYFGSFVTVEDCQRFPIRGLIKSFKTKSAEAILEAKVMIKGTQVHLTATPMNFGGTRFWFLCPGCQCRLSVLLAHPLTRKIGCRRCLGVEYRAKRYKGMVESNFA